MARVPMTNVGNMTEDQRAEHDRLSAIRDDAAEDLAGAEALYWEHVRGKPGVLVMSPDPIAEHYRITAYRHDIVKRRRARLDECYDALRRHISDCRKSA